MPAYVYALWSGHASPTVQLEKGEAWDPADPFVKAHKDWFTDEAPVVRRTTTVNFTKDSADLASPPQPKTPAVEAATAAPGEKRDLPPAKAAKAAKAAKGA